MNITKLIKTNFSHLFFIQIAENALRMIIQFFLIRVKFLYVFELQCRALPRYFLKIGPIFKQVSFC